MMLQEVRESIFGYPLLPTDATGAMKSEFQRMQNLFSLLFRHKKFYSLEHSKNKHLSAGLTLIAFSENQMYPILHHLRCIQHHSLSTYIHTHLLSN